MRKLLVVSIILCSLSHPLSILAQTTETSQEADPESATPIEWSTNASRHSRELGEHFVYRCPPNGSPGEIWGTDVYTSDSSICTAAMHAGKITAEEGGVVILRIHRGVDLYAGTTRHGVASADLGPWDASFVLLDAVGAPTQSELIPTIDWGTIAELLRGYRNQSFTFRCPPGGSLGEVWGTGTYTDDSSICTAAVHAGKITVDDGGIIAITMRVGEHSYLGSSRNGVETKHLGRWEGSFVVD